MKKKILGLLSLLSMFLTFTYVVSGQSATSSATASPSATVMEKDAQSIEEKTMKAVEQQMKNSKAVGGVIQSITGNTIKIKTPDGLLFDIKVDDALTKLFNVATGVKKEIKMDALKKDSYIIATGIKNDNTVNANFIYQDEQYVVGSGKISEVNSTDYYVKVVTTESESITLDIESYTKMNLVDIKTLELTRIGFSKMKEGDTVHFVYKKAANPQEANRYSAQRIVVLPQEFFIGK